MAPVRMLAAAAVAAVFALPAAATAQDCVAPPGTGAVDQYCETIPSATGDQGKSEGGGGSGDDSRPAPGTTSAAVDPSTREALEQSGTDGRGVLAIPNERRKRAEQQEVGGRDLSNDPGRDPLSAVTNALGSGTTVGTWFPLVLALLAGLVLGAGWLRVRNQPRP